jgi:hypothetical protein
MRLPGKPAFAGLLFGRRPPDAKGLDSRGGRIDSQQFARRGRSKDKPVKSRASRIGASFLVSCGVYGLPVIGPHALFFSGGLLAVSVREWLEGRRPIGWVGMELALLLGLQAAIGLACYWGLGKRFRLALALVAPLYLIAQVAVFSGMAYAIPVLFLVGKETAPECTPWPVQGEFADVDLFSPDPATRNRFQESSKLLLRNWAGNHYRIVPIPEGTSVIVPVRNDHFATALAGITPSGAYLYSVLDPASSRYDWFRSGSAEGKPVQETAPAGGPSPIWLHLLPSGQGVAWMEIPRGAPARFLTRTVEQGNGVERAVVLEGSAWQSPVFLDREDDGTLWVLASGRGLMRYDASGRKTGQWADIGGVPFQVQGFQRNRHGKLAWEVYRDTGPCRVAWEAEGAAPRVVELPAGKSATSASLSPDGRWVAVSTTTGLNIGSQRDSVVVYRTSTGSEAFRIYLPRYTRSEVWFAGNTAFAYSTIEGQRSKVVVRRIVEEENGGNPELLEAPAH